MEGTPVYFPKNGEVLDFYAYYPYSKTLILQQSTMMLPNPCMT